MDAAEEEGGCGRRRVGEVEVSGCVRREVTVVEEGVVEQQ